MSSRTKVIVSKKWTHNAPIEVFACHEDVGASMSAEDFIKALVEESGSGMFTTQASLITKLTAAIPAVVAEMKSYVKKVV